MEPYDAGSDECIRLSRSISRAAPHVELFLLSLLTHEVITDQRTGNQGLRQSDLIVPGCISTWKAVP